MTSIPLAVSYDCTPPNNASQIQKSLTKLLNGASGGLGGAFDMVSGLNTAVSEISASMSSLTTSMSSLLEDSISGYVSTALTAAKNFIFNKITNPLAAIAQNNSFLTSAFKPIGKLFGAFGCLGSTIQKALKSTIKNLLTNMIGKGFINPLECAVEDFIGTLTNKISSLMDGIIGPLLDPINSLFSIVGMGFGKVTDVLGKGLNILGKLNGLLNCKDSGATCHQVEHWGLNKGSSKPDSSAKKQNFISRAINKGNKKIGNLAGKLDKKTVNLQDKLLNDPDFKRDETTCNAGNVLECGLPRVEFFGGGGEGGAGSVILGNFIQELDDAIAKTETITPEGETQQVGSILEDVKTTGSILGVDITYPGEGYTSEPLVSFVDNCDQGYGAYGRATIDKDPNSPTFGQITGVLMLSEGENYPTGEQTDVFVDRIVVEKGGSGYKLDDKAGDFEICGVDENGSITKVCTNDKVYRTLPPANVESITGSGAVLTPVMTTRRRETGVINVIDCITPRGNIVGYVNGKEYNGPFHVMPNGLKMTGLKHSDTDSTIYNTPQESLRSGGAPTSNVGSTKIGLRSIQQLVTESESTQTTTPQTTENTDLYSDPVDEATDTSGGSTPPSSPPPSSPPSSGSSGGGYGY
tara:strand:- start:299 stop:2206 length:1908 start_codon:yes stop_codon:yes gene_type:complete